MRLVILLEFNLFIYLIKGSLNFFDPYAETGEEDCLSFFKIFLHAKKDAKHKCQKKPSDASY